MKAGHRTRRSFQHAFSSTGESDGWPVIALFEPRGEDADYTLMPFGFEQAQAERHRLQRQVPELRQGFTLHALLDGFAVLIELVQLYGPFAGQRLVFTEQAFDAQAHVVQTPRRVEPRPEDEAKIGGSDA